jgi:hypothetical protein
LAEWLSSAGPSAGRVNAGDFGTVGGISLGIGNSRGASYDTVSRGLDNGALGARDLSVIAISSGGPASRVLGSSSSNIGTTDSGISSMSVGDNGRSLPGATAATRWARPATPVMCAQAAALTTMLNTQGMMVSLSVH